MNNADLAFYVFSALESAGFEEVSASSWQCQVDSTTPKKLEVLFGDLRPYFAIESPKDGTVVCKAKHVKLSLTFQTKRNVKSITVKVVV